MKKKITVLVLILIVAVMVVSLASCGKNPFLESKRWSSHETLTYNVLSKTENGTTEVGTMTVVYEELKDGQYKLRGSDRAFATSGATRITKTVVDKDGKEIVYSESIMQNFVPVASYKKIDYNNIKQDTRARYYKGVFYYSNNGGPEKKSKIKKGFVDNELIYDYVRCQEIDRTFASNVSIVDARSGVKEAIAIAVSGKGVYNNEFTYNDLNNETKTRSKVETILVKIGKTVEPKGNPIYVSYAARSGKDGFIMDTESGRKSYYPAVQIVENEMVYNLVSIVQKIGA